MATAGDSSEERDGGGDGDDGAMAPPDPQLPSGEGPADGDGGEDVDASLHLALSDLERMLDGQESAEGTEPGAEPGGPELDEDGEQYTIPLLDEVAIPGPSAVVPPAPAAAEPVAPLADDEPSIRARIAERIASEIDVIAQDRIERALESAREEIREQVRNHLDIILPEIVEELTQARRRQDGS